MITPLLCKIASLNSDQTVALSAVLVAVVAAAVAVWQGCLLRKAIQLQLFENAFRDIRDREAAFTKRYMLPLSGLETHLKNQETDLANAGESVSIVEMFRTLKDAHHVTAFELFNTVEYLAFLINNRLVDNTRLKSFFRPAFLFWYEELFRKHCPEEEKDPNKYEEFKKLYRTLGGDRWGSRAGLTSASGETGKEKP